MKKVMKIGFGAAVLGLISLAGFVMYLRYAMVKPGPTTEETTVLISADKSPLRVLNEAGLIPSPFLFKVNLYLKGQTRALKRGEYKFPARASMNDVLQMLVDGKVVVHTLTIPEGLTSFQIMALLENTPDLSGQAASGAEPPNGTLLPETYAYVYGDTRASIVDRMKRAMDQYFEPLFQNQTLFKTRDEALSMACLIEKETHLDAERPIVSSVFHNRLKKRMRMQSDPTVIFAITEGRYALTRRLTLKDLQMPHPYNTYVVHGLPPKPICNPGKASIAAAFSPAETDFLYFVADPAEGHTFARTIEEHNQNVAAWRKSPKRQKQIRK